ncbi:MAG: outer membrane beta-barrel protein [Bacteroidales bacterium]|nr:outer membrane beta-barrel protein [Bacteroidales bacterium]
MKRLFIFLTATWLMAGAAFAQEDLLRGRSDRLMIDFFTDIWSNAPENMDMNTINRGINITMMQDFPLGNSPISFATGLGIASHNLYSDHFFDYAPMFWSSTFPQPGTYDFTPIGDTYGEVKKNKLNLNYLNLPLELRYRNNSLPHTFRITAGVRAGYLVNAHTKTHIKNDNGGVGISTQEERKYKEHKLGNLEKFQFGLSGRIGYGRINLNAYLPLTKIFKDNSVTDMKPFSLGLTFIVY